MDTDFPSSLWGFIEVPGHTIIIRRGLGRGGDMLIYIKKSVGQD